MLEVEIKVKITDPQSIRAKFEENNGIYKISFIHEDTYFNMPQGLRDFRKTDEALRIRKSIESNNNIHQQVRKTNYFITYKGKRIDKTTKTRNELEVKLEDGEQLKEILRILGFKEIFTVKKERDMYEFDFKGQLIEALIDYIPLLKEYFIEVEIVSETADELDKSREILFEFLSLFNIEKGDSIRKSYLELIADRFRGEIIR